jgi:hypothetical protein
LRALPQLALSALLLQSLAWLLRAWLLQQESPGASPQPDLPVAWRRSPETVAAAQSPEPAGAAAQFCEAPVWLPPRKLPEAPEEWPASAVWAR